MLPDGTAVPAADLAEVLQGEEAAYIRHHITTVDIRFAGPDEATADVFFFAITNEPRQTTGATRVTPCGARTTEPD